MREALTISRFCENDLHSNCHMSWCECECHNKKEVE